MIKTESKNNMLHIREKQMYVQGILTNVLVFFIYECLTTLVMCNTGNGSLPIKPDIVSPGQASVIIPTSPDYGYDGYDYPSYDQYDVSIFRVDTDHCNGRSSCSDSLLQSFPETLCHCDGQCGLLNDCCWNYDNIPSSLLSKDQFECVSLHEIVKNRQYGVTMVTKCSPEWDHSVTKTLCENKEDPNDILLRLPVTEKTDLGIMFKNMYCAQCNRVEDFEYWNPELKCKNETGVRYLPGEGNCSLFFLRPRPKVSYRTCQVSPSVISVCPNSSQTNTDELVFNCTDGAYSLAYDESGKIFRNKYCAVCSGVQGPIYCDNINREPYTVPTMDPRSSTYSFRFLVDFNAGTESRNGKEKKIQNCKHNEIYDSFSGRCRTIFCAPPRIPTNGKCRNTGSNVPKASIGRSYSATIRHLENCTLTRLEPSEYEFTNNSELFIISQQKVYSNENFRLNGSDVFICLDKIQECLTDCKPVRVKLISEVIESYLSLVGLIVSILCLATTLIIYVALPQLLNTPGKILVSLIVSLLLAQLLFLTASEAETVPNLCFAIGVSIHYFFLAAFCWMNVIALDLWMTFSNRFITPGSESKGTKRFVLYSLYAWLIPVTIVVIAIILDFVEFDVQYKHFKPGYGNRICWISSKDALLLFFAGPLALFKLFDVVSFIFTAVHIARAKKQGKMASRKKNTCSFIINIKLSLIMGLTWVFAFVANITNDIVSWYLFIVFNSLQGLFIAICFLCTKKVKRLVGDKYKSITTRYTSGTQVTSVS